MSNSDIATVVSVTGQAFARSEDGELRAIFAGDTLKEGETVVTAQGNDVELEFIEDGSSLLVTDMPELLLTPDLLAQSAASADQGAIASESLDELLIALDSGADLSEALEAPAAGLGGAGGTGEGHSFVRLARIEEETTPAGIESVATATSLLAVEAVGTEADIDPDAVDDSFNIDEGTALTGSLMGNDDPGDGPTFVTAFDDTSANGGAVVVDTLGNFTYTPAQGFTGVDTFTYTIADSDGDTDTATVTVNVNDLPDAVDDNFSVDEGAQLTGNLLGNDDLGNEATSVTDFDSTSTRGGTVTIDDGGTFTYTPPQDFTGSDTFDYTITDVDGDTSTATVTINVNDLPDAIDDTFNIDEGAQLTGNVMGNDDLGNEATTVTAFDGTSANGGAVAVDAGGDFTYIPAQGFIGTDTFTYTITDSDGDSDTATVTVIVNDLPDAIDDTFNIDGSAPLTGNLLGNDDLGNEATSVTAFDDTSVNGGAVVVDAGGNFTYTPAAGFNGSDTFTYTITDSDGDSDTATVTVNVDALPDAIDDTFSVDEGVQLIGNVMGNDDQGDGPANVTAFNDTSASGGAVAVDSVGNFTYTPADGFSGVDTFDYTITDSDGDTDTATVTVNVIADVNELPDAVNDSFNIDEGAQLTGTLMGNDDQGDGPATVTAFTSPNNGTVSVDTVGIFTYTPAANFTGVDTFTYTITDSNGDTDTATVTVNVNDLPDAVDDTFSVDAGATVFGSVLGNDDLGNDPTVVTPVSGTLPSGATMSINAEGNFSYTPAQGFSGADMFEYTITDSDGDTSTATVRLLVDTENQLPDAVDDTFNVSEGTELTGTLMGNDDQGDGPAKVTPIDVTLDSGATVKVDDGGNFTYTPAQGFTGDDTFEYTITDTDGDTSTATVTVTVVDENDAPEVASDAYNVTEDIVLEITDPAFGVLANDSDPDGDTLTATIATQAAHGVVALESDGTFTYTPDADYNGADSFTYQASDGLVISDPVTVTLNVGAVDDAIDDSISTSKDTPIIIDVFAGTAPIGAMADNFEDGDAEVITLTGAFGSSTTVTTVEGGIATLNLDGTVTYAPREGFEGQDTFEYEVKAANGDGNETATVTVTVTPVNNPPIAEDLFIDNGQVEVPPSRMYTVDLDKTVAEITGSGSIGVDTATDRIDQIEYDAATGLSEEVVFELGQDANSVSFDVSRLYQNEEKDGYKGTDETGHYTLYKDGNIVGEGDFVATSNNQGSYTITEPGGFDKVVFTAVEFSDGESGVNDANNDGLADDGTFAKVDAAGTDVVGSASRTDSSDYFLSNVAFLRNEGAFEGGEPITGQLVATDIDLDELIYSLGTTTSEGIVTVNPDGSFEFDPADDFQDLNIGDDRTVSFDYNVSDGHGGSDSGTVSIVVAGTSNDAPTAVVFEASTAEVAANNTVVAESGGEGGDTLIGSDEGDDFVWYLGADGADTTVAPAPDTIADFNAEEGDRVVLHDLLPDDTDDITDYIKVEVEDGDTVISLSTAGTVKADDAGVDQKIILTDVDWVGGDSTQADIINGLIEANLLDVD